MKKGIIFNPTTGQGDCRDGRRIDLDNEISPFGSVNRERRDQEIDLAILGIRHAILNEGVNPEYHRDAVRRLEHEWPTLYHAIMRLIQVT